MESLYGMKFVSSDSCFTWETEQYFVPRSKKRRIQKKCRKLWIREVFTPTAYKMGDTIFAHPFIIDKIRRGFNVKPVESPSYSDVFSYRRPGMENL